MEGRAQRLMILICSKWLLHSKDLMVIFPFWNRCLPAMDTSSTECADITKWHSYFRGLCDCCHSHA